MDDEWGDDGADWDDDSGGDDWGNDDGDDEEDEQPTLKLEIENQYYQAEAEARTDPKTALAQYRKCVDLVETCQEEEGLGDEERTRRFKSLQAIAVLLIKLEKESEVLKAVDTLLKYISEVTRNDSWNALEAVISKIGDSNMEKVAMEVFRMTLETLDTPRHAQLWFQTAMKLCKDHMKERRYSQATELVEKCHKTLKKKDGSDDKSKSSQLLEIYAVKMEVATMHQDKGDESAAERLKDLFDRTSSLVADVNNPKVMSIITECFGKMYGSVGNWTKAYEEFSKAFDFYNTYGDNRLKRVLKYMVISNILSGGEHDVFGARKTKVHESDPEVNPVVNLMNAYRNDRVIDFQNVLRSNRTSALSDPFVSNQVKALLLKLRSKYLIKLIVPYKRVQMKWLSRELDATEEETENIVHNLILDGSISGKLDQVENILDLSPNVEDPYAKALGKWLDGLKRVRKVLVGRLNETKTMNKRSGSFSGIDMTFGDEMMDHPGLKAVMG